MALSKDLGWDRKKNSRGMEQSDKKNSFYQIKGLPWEKKIFEKI